MTTASRRAPEAPSHAGSPDGNTTPMSGSPAAASSASQRAWATTSPSEWPTRPSSWGTCDRAEHQRPPRAEAVGVGARADPHAHRIGACDGLAAREAGDGLVAGAAQGGDGRGVVAGDVVRGVGVARERRRHARLAEPRQQRRRRVELADRLAQAGGRALDRHARRGDRRDRGVELPPRAPRGMRAPKTLGRSGWESTSKSPDPAAATSSARYARPHLLGGPAAPVGGAGVVDRPARRSSAPTPARRRRAAPPGTPRSRRGGRQPVHLDAEQHRQARRPGRRGPPRSRRRRPRWPPRATTGRRSTRAPGRSGTRAR